jgi:hypothetical protein
MTVCPKSLDMDCAKILPNTSVEPPGGNGTTIEICFSGYTANARDADKQLNAKSSL